MATTNLGFPLFAQTDNADIASKLNAIAQAANDYFLGTKPTALTGLVSGWAAVGGGIFAARKGSVVVVFGALQNSGFAATAFTTVASLPTGIPVPPINVGCKVWGNTAQHRSAQLTTGGSLQFINEAATNAFYEVMITYPAV